MFIISIKDKQTNLWQKKKDNQTKHTNKLAIENTKFLEVIHTYSCRPYDVPTFEDGFYCRYDELLC